MLTTTESGDVEDDGLSEWSFGEFTIAGDRVLLVELNWDVVKRANMSRNDLFGNHKYIVTISGIRREGTSVYYMVSDLTKAF